MTPTDVQVFIRSEIAQEMYDYLKQENLLPEEPKNEDQEPVEQSTNCLLTRLCRNGL